MKKMVLIIIFSILTASFFMSGGYGLWQEEVIISGSIKVKPKTPVGQEDVSDYANEDTLDENHNISVTEEEKLFQDENIDNNTEIANEDEVNSSNKLSGIDQEEAKIIDDINETNTSDVQIEDGDISGSNDIDSDTVVPESSISDDSNIEQEYVEEIDKNEDTIYYEEESPDTDTSSEEDTPLGTETINYNNNENDGDNILNSYEEVSDSKVSNVEDDSKGTADENSLITDTTENSGDNN